MEDGVFIPSPEWGECHYEAELAILIGQTLKQASLFDAQQSILGIGLALDLTLRDQQKQLKERGLPWELAKAFDDSCPVTPFISCQHTGAYADLQHLSFSLHINGQLKQRGMIDDMIFSIDWLIAHMSQTFTLNPGDIVLTGTPAGVGALHKEDQIELSLMQSEQTFTWNSTVHRKSTF